MRTAIVAIPLWAAAWIVGWAIGSALLDWAVGW